MTEQQQLKNIKSLLNDLQNTEDDYIRKVAAEQLGEQETSNEKVVVALRKIAESDPNKYVRDAANNSLAKLGVETVSVEESLPTVEEKKSKKWALIGLLAGLIPGLIMIILFPNGKLAVLFCFGALLGIPFGLLGAYLGRRNDTTVWIGSIAGVVLGVALFIWFAVANCLLCQ